MIAPVLLAAMLFQTPTPPPGPPPADTPTAATPAAPGTPPSGAPGAPGGPGGPGRFRRGRNPGGPGGPGGPGAPDGAASPAADKEKEKDKDPTDDDTPVVTHHTIDVGDGRTIKYTATAGMMPLKSDTGDVDARIFYIAYTMDNPPAKRPLMFAFNGGPGSSSVWLHMGNFGPRRVKLQDNGSMPPPPFQLVDNEETWLDKTDLCFIDPVGTGYSHASKPENNKNYWGITPDIQSVSEFVRMYISRNDRWGSPLFVTGESYGTFRAASLAGALNDDGIALNGVILISTILNYNFNQDDTAAMTHLPTYTATAWYHKKLAADLEARPLDDVLKEVEHWALTDYDAALVKGDRLSAPERETVVDTLARYSGLDKSYVDNANLRITDGRFFKEILRDRKRTVGRYDTRFLGIDPDAAGERAGYDPSDAAVGPPFTMAFNQYVRGELNFKSDREYSILTPVPWDTGSGGGRGGGFGRTITDSSIPLRDALTQNPYLKVFVAEGHYDLATPYFAVEDTLSHMRLDPAARGRISSGQYDAGHMMYIDASQRRKLKKDVSAFLDSALNPTADAAASVVAG